MATAPSVPARCLCHKLLFTRSGNTIEIKCNKCKRILCIETAGILSMTFRQDPAETPQTGTLVGVEKPRMV